ncbi:hypothetical protein [Rhizomicrobium electricum]|uniref:Uncharacterized protein n=1 Tax=Rhizomicrobium electricum TaxID=480070 RepID=A0ABN1FAW1_9PROT|nr:hypothetical protein [Rhizomicrobium electricum]NIJ50695.1 hypothetical protein [Rhizomicrobium electricum]
MRRWHLIVLLPILAIVLGLCLVRYAECLQTTFADYHVTRTIPDDPVLTSSVEGADVACLGGPTCDVRAFAKISGFFPRPGVPRLAALLGGIVAPVLLIFAAIGIAIRRRSLRVVPLSLAALFLFGMMLDVPGRYFDGTSNADVRQQISAQGIYVTKVEAGMDCLGTNPCFKTPYYAFTQGVFAAKGVPKLMAIGLGLALPGLLLFGSIVVAFWPRSRKTPS